MTPVQIATLRHQIGETQAGFADRLREIDPLLAPNRHTVARWERTDSVTPNAHAVAALTRLWLDEGYPATVGTQDAIITTNHPASSYGLPVVVLAGQARGSAEVGAVIMHGAPETVVDAMRRAGYQVG